MANEFLCVRRGGDKLSIVLLRVQDIRRYEAPTSVSKVPRFIEGFVNLRGLLVPIVDLRLKLGCEKAE